MVAWLLVCSFAIHEAPQAPTIRAESERYSVEALDAGGDDRPARVIVSNNATSRRHMVMVNSTLGELRRAIIRDDQERVTLVMTKGFAVIDPAGVANTDEVYALDATVSPGGRWIAFRRFFPATHPGPSDGVAVYDTRETPDSNHAVYPIAAEREWRAGRAIYPPAGQWKDANAVASPAEAHTLSSPLTWEGARGAPVLLFSMRHGGTETLVLADLASDDVRACWGELPGGADRWRVKTMMYSRSAAGEHVVRVTSGALDRSSQSTISIPADGCKGALPPR